MMDYTKARAVKRGYSGLPRIMIDDVIWEVNAQDNELIRRGMTVTITDEELYTIERAIVYNFLINQEAS